MSRRPNEPSFRDGVYRGLHVELKVVRRFRNYRPLEITTPYQVYRFMRDVQNDSAEHMYVLSLDHRHNLGAVYLAGKGSCNHCYVDPKEVFKPVILSAGAGFALVHNHPSGDPSPSAEDLAFTRRIKEGGEILNVHLIDHLIIGIDGYVSMVEKGLLK